MLRPITFDDQAARGPQTTWCTSTSGTRSCSAPRASCAARCSASTRRCTGSPRSWSTGLPQSCVAAVSRLVLVGRGGLRLHEEVFLTGIRLRGQAHGRGEGRGGPRPGPRRPGPGPGRTSRSGRRLARAVERRRRARCGPGCSTAMDHARRSPPGEGRPSALRTAPGRRHRAGPGDLRRVPRQPARVPRPARPARSAAEDEMLFADDQQRQRRRDLAAMERPPGQPRRRGTARDRRDRASATPTSSRTSPRPPSCSR